MPIYEFVCPSCKLKFEQLRSLSRADEGTTCPRCHNVAQRVLSTFACLSKDEGGATSPIGGSSCAGCSASSCTTCGG